jgi:hypothetical protein
MDFIVGRPPKSHFNRWVTEKKNMKRIIVTVLALCTIMPMIDAKELERVEEKKARSLLALHLKSISKTPEAFAFNLRPFGKSTWLIDCYTKDEEPSISWRHVMNSRGEVKELTMDSLNIVFLNEYGASPEEKERKKLIEDFTTLHSGERVSVINKTADIPGYAKAPLDADIADAVRAPFSFGKLTTVVYTYQQIGGIVRRYRFTFDNGTTFRKAECAIVGRNIGDAQYYE